MIFLSAMKRCKFINEFHVRWYHNPLKEENQTYSNPSQEQLEKLGYMPFRDTAKGESISGFVQIPHYHIEDCVIIRTWKYELESELP